MVHQSEDVGRHNAVDQLVGTMLTKGELPGEDQILLVSGRAGFELVQKTIAAGIPGIQVDGNDVVAVRHTMEEALARARAGEGPTLIEATTYRLSDHTTADDASRYRDDEKVSAHWKAEPIVRLRGFLAGAGHWDSDKEEELLTACREQVEAAVAEYESMAPQAPDSMFEHLYAELPKSLESQRGALRRPAGQEETADHD